MRLALNVLAVLLILPGSIFALQGLNILLGSFMSGSSQWFYIGVVMVIVGVAVLVGANWKRK